MKRPARSWRERVWRREGALGWLVWLGALPLSWLFGLGVALRDLAFRIGLLGIERAPLPVISIGNLSVGGTGKTPMTLWLARQLRHQGFRVGIVLRGYGGKASEVTVVSKGEGPLVSASVGGDEAVMLARVFDGPVIAAPRRIDGARRAAELGCDVVVLDDGFQHRALHRDVDLVLLGEQGRFLLPAGPLREGLGALHRADAVVLVRKLEGDTPPEVTPPPGKPLFLVRFAARSLIESHSGRWHELPVNTLAGRSIAAVCGIAQPEAFYATVRQWEGQIEEIFEFPDHHTYRDTDWQELLRKTRDVDLIVTTEKDLVKLESFPFARGKLVAVRVEPEVERGDELVRLVMERAGLVDRHSTDEMIE